METFESSASTVVFASRFHVRPLKSSDLVVLALLLEVFHLHLLKVLADRPQRLARPEKSRGASKTASLAYISSFHVTFSGASSHLDLRRQLILLLFQLCIDLLYLATT